MLNPWPRPKRSQDAFLKLDGDRSGYIEAGEFRKFLDQYALDPGSAEQLVALLDKNGDGWIEYRWPRIALKLGSAACHPPESLRP